MAATCATSRAGKIQTETLISSAIAVASIHFRMSNIEFSPF